LSWLPARDAVLSRLAATLKPGGWLVVEDFDSVLHRCLDPLNDEERVFDKVADAFGQALHRRDVDTTWPRTLPHRLAAAGSPMSARPGTWPSSTAVRPPLSYGSPTSTRSETGSSKLLITTAERDTFRRLLDDPSFVGNYPLLITAWGKKPNLPG
jgi:hypothetical protein